VEWIDVKIEKPKDYCVCLVVNVNYGFQMFLAVYHKNYDVFVLSDPDQRKTTCLAVTHYINIPALPIND
jgi:hypothetical protein